MEFFQCITDFIFVEDEPREADVLFVPGGNYPDAARRAAGLYRQGYAPYVLPSGKYSILKGRFEIGAGEGPGKTDFFGNPAKDCGKADCGGNQEAARPAAGFETECEYLCGVLRQEGVPEKALIREDQATFTYENAIYSRKKLDAMGIRVRRGILCCQAFHARRCLMYYQEQFPEAELLVCPVVTKGISRDTWHRFPEGIDTVLGEVERCGGQFHQIMREHLPGETLR